MPFKPGNTVNLSGKPKQYEGVAELARACGQEMIRILKRIAKDRKQSGATRVAAATHLLDRGFGRAASFSTSDVDDFKRATDMSDEELIRIAVRGGIELDVPRETKSAADYPVVTPGSLPERETKQYQ